jgi:CHAD domain-containing protein
MRFFYFSFSRARKRVPHRSGKKKRERAPTFLHISKLLFTQKPRTEFLRRELPGVVIYVSVFVLSSASGHEEFLQKLGETFSLQVVPTTTEEVTYRDTFDWRLHKAGFTFSTSGTGRNTRLMLGRGRHAPLEARGSRVPHWGPDLPPGLIRESVEAPLGHRRLLPMAKATWRSAEVAMLNEDEKIVMRIRLKDGRVLSREKEGGISLPVRLECYPLKGYGREERKITRHLLGPMGMEREDATELTAVLSVLGRRPGDYSPSFRIALPPELAAGTALKLIHQGLLKGMLANLEGVTRDWDTEFLHDFRVAVRRTRSALGQVEGVFPPQVVSHFAHEFRWLGSKTGPTRDLDVYLQRIPAYRSALPHSADRDLEPLVRLLNEKRSAEHGQLLRCLRSERFQRLVDDWRSFLEGPQTLDAGSPNGFRPILELASERIARAFARVLLKGEVVTPDSPAEALHRLRISCKKLRYLITLFRSLFPAKRLDPIIVELKRLQDHLGEFNDLQVQQETLRAFAQELMDSGRGPPATLLAMGQLLGRLDGAQARERGAFHHHFRQFSRPKNRKRFLQLFGADPGLGDTAEMGEVSR